MYTVLKITEYVMDREIILKNCTTGAVETCFDNSLIFDEGNFEFMRVGEKYDCKILLHGYTSSENCQANIECLSTGKDVLIGSERLSEVIADDNVYFVRSENLPTDMVPGRKIFYACTRKDLIEVDQRWNPVLCICSDKGKASTDSFNVKKA